MTEFRREALPHDLAPYRSQAETQTMGQFEGALPFPFLLYARSKLWDPTLTAQAQGSGRETQLVDYNMLTGGMTFLSPIRKLQSAKGDAGITLGRDTDNDVVVPVPSVSSKHAIFNPPHSGPSPAWSITDIGSRNGTYYNEQRIDAYDATPLNDGDYLRLGGNLIAWFLYPGRLWHLLRSDAELKKLTDL